MVAKVCKIQKVLNFTYFNQKKKKKKPTTVLAKMCKYYSCANNIFYSFFLSLPLHLALFLYLLLTTKLQNHPCSSLNHQFLSSSNNKITKPPLPSINHRSRWYHPNRKTQKLKLAITHHNTKTQKLKLAITHHRISKN